MEEQYLKQYFGFGPSECIFHTLFLKHLVIAKPLLTDAYHITWGFFYAYF